MPQSGASGVTSIEFSRTVPAPSNASCSGGRAAVTGSPPSRSSNATAGEQQGVGVGARHGHRPRPEGLLGALDGDLVVELEGHRFGVVDHQPRDRLRLGVRGGALLGLRVEDAAGREEAVLVVPRLASTDRDHQDGGDRREGGAFGRARADESRTQVSRPDPRRRAVLSARPAQLVKKGTTDSGSRSSMDETFWQVIQAWPTRLASRASRSTGNKPLEGVTLSLTPRGVTPPSVSRQPRIRAACWQYFTWREANS